MNSLIARATCACLLVLMSRMVLAQPGESEESAGGQPLSLRQAVDFALQRNPELQAFGFELRAQAARSAAAALRPSPQLEVTLEDLLGSGRVAGIDAAQATFALSQVLELGGKREARITTGRSGADLLEIERQARQLDVVAEVARRYLHVASDQEQLRLTRLGTELVRQTVTATQRRVNAAKAPVVELRRARVALVRAEVEEEHAEHELLTSRHNLAALWGDTTPVFGPVEADLYRLPQPSEFESLTVALERNPDTLRFISEARLRDAEIRLAETRMRADLNVSAGVRRYEEGDDQALVFGVSMPLFGASRARPAVAEAQALRGRSEADAAAHRVKVRARLFELHQELLHAIAEAASLRDRVLPEMEAVLKDTQYAFERGRYGYLELVDAQRERIAVQRALIESAANAHRYQTEIERLTGVALPTVSP